MRKITLTAIFVLLAWPVAAANRTDTSAAKGRVSAVQTVPPGPILQRWVKALGGPRRLRKLRVIDSQLSVGMNGNSAGYALHTIETAGGQFRYDWVGSDNVSGAYDGNRAWYSSSVLGFGYVAPQDVVHRFWQSPILQALPLLGNTADMRVIGREYIEQEPCTGVSLQLLRGETENWYFSDSTGQLIRIEQPASDNRAELTITFSDFRKVQGVTIPFQIVFRHGPQTINGHRFSANLYDETSIDTFQPAPADARQARQIDEILQAYESAASLGKDISTRVTRATQQVLPSGVVTQLTISQKKPKFFLREEHSPGLGVNYTGFDGSTAWVNSEILGFHSAKGAELSRIQAEALWQTAADSIPQYPIRRYVRRTTLHGRDVVIITMAAPWSIGSEVYFDAATHLLTRIETEIETNTHKRIRATVDYDDYRLVDGVQVPFKTTWTTPTATSIITCESVAFNVPLSDDLFRVRDDDE